MAILPEAGALQGSLRRRSIPTNGTLMRIRLTRSGHMGCDGLYNPPSRFMKVNDVQPSVVDGAEWHMAHHKLASQSRKKPTPDGAWFSEIVGTSLWRRPDLSDAKFFRPYNPVNSAAAPIPTTLRRHFHCRCRSHRKAGP